MALDRAGSIELRAAEELVRTAHAARMADCYRPFPLSELQSAYWFGERATSELAGVRVHCHLEFDVPNLKLDRLEHAINCLIAEQPMMRAVVDNDGYQRILAHVPRYTLPVRDLSQMPPHLEQAALESARSDLESGRRLRSDVWPNFHFEVDLLRDGRRRLRALIGGLFADGPSFGMVLKGLQRFYYDPDRPPDTLAVWPRDYVCALAQLRQGPAYQESLDYWRRRIPSLPMGPDLPLSLTPASPPLRLYHHEERIEPDAWKRMQTLARQFGLTTVTAAMTAYADTLALWSRSPRFTLNTLMGGRVPFHPDVFKMLGNYTGTLLLALDHSSPGEPFAERALRLRRQLKEDLKHSRVSGVRVAREMAQRAGGAPRPIAPVVFVSQLQPWHLEDRRSLGIWTDCCVYQHMRTPHVWIDHQLWEQKGWGVLSWAVADDLFPPGMPDEMLHCYAEQLTRLGREVSAWTETSRARVSRRQLSIRVAANQTEHPLPERATLSGMFVERAAGAPSAPAVVAPSRTLSYGQLERWSSALAGELVDAGVEPGQLVGIYMRRGWEQVVAALAILRAGAAYLPLDPALPTDRVRMILDDAGVGCLVIQPGLARQARGFGRTVMTVAEEPAAAAGASPDPRLAGRAPEPTALAYVIYTSGSTGKPKGVMIDHRGAVNTILDINRRFRVGSADRVLALSSLSFDLSVYDLFGALAAGAALVVPEADLDREPSHWVDLMGRHHVSVWNSVPQLMAMMVEHLRGRPTRALDRLRLVLLSGDWIPVSLPEQIKQAMPGARVISLGGATEASIWSIFHPIDWVDPTWKSIPYGRPLANQTWQVLNEWLEPCPIWVPGELCIGGAGVALGYLGDEDKTRAKFIEHPEHGRLYRTGDLGRYLPDGSLEFLGRMDSQVKVQGYRIELGEIESVLQQHPAVRAAAVVALGEPQGERRLAGFVVPADGEVPDEVLRKHLGDALPEYMVPPTLTWLTELPLSSNGKVDRAQLVASGAHVSARVSGPVEPPRTALEQALCRMWEELLEVSPVGVNQNFFELGGQSFLAVRLMSRILRELGADLPLTSLISAGTVEALARLIEDRTDHSSPLVTLTRGAGRPDLFCVHPSGGLVLCYVELAGRLEDRVRFHGLAAPGLEGDMAPHRSTEELARTYVEALRRVAPRGPYRLAGWSSGGVVALAMAHALRAAGEEVSSLILLDTEPPESAPEDTDQRRMTELFVGDLLQLSGTGDGEVNLGRGDVAGAYRALRRAGRLPDDFTEERFAQLRAVYAANLRGTHAYRPRPYPGDLTLLRARAGLVDDDGGWQRLVAGRLDVRTVPGDHYTMFRGKNLDVLAAELARCIEDGASASGAGGKDPGPAAGRAGAGNRVTKEAGAKAAANGVTKKAGAKAAANGVTKKAGAKAAANGVTKKAGAKAAANGVKKQAGARAAASGVKKKAGAKAAANRVKKVTATPRRKTAPQAASKEKRAAGRRTRS